ncbi:grasp-with-spasm system ATP-grasp peptide maturase [uncultured Tenacibaculum sp.]|uniref:grasp-with-spasm system ATP-grasp peptide maturase n=1 Tax=uncultured Tenacibaculum sp. TaxID=174713 RepID=UPI002629279D|nr:grasp-with-spasm system ATP-grasp peptide maturase [uncultured Tenacibaculum sp.]
MKKHLIITEDRDSSSNEVCSWFYKEGICFKRLNLDSYKEIDPSSDLYSDYFNFNNIEISISDEIKAFEEKFEKKYKSIWYRRPSFSLKNTAINQPDSEIPEFLLPKIRFNQNSELKELYEYIFNFSLKASLILGNRLKTRVNKLEVLSLAKELGISIPRTKVVSLKSQLLQFQKEINNTLITKSIYEPLLTWDDLGNKFISYTNVLTDLILDKIPEQFSPSLVQEKIEKDCEIRTFVLHEKFYSMAIFSQANEKTKVDFRRYDTEKPNRTIPFILPEGLKIKIKELLKRIGLNTGSVDVIKATNGKYYFLEINPVGQFGMVSKPCNYNIEYDIFKHLTKHEEKTS